MSLCVVTFCLNEEKFLRYAISSWLTSDDVDGVVVVEGAVRQLSEYATHEGLSKDNTAAIVKRIQKTHTRGSDVHYRAHGWAANKAELQNAGLRMAQRVRNTEWIVLAGGDELYTESDLNRLAAICSRSNADVLNPTFRHFWRRPDVVAVGSSWSVKMHRVYRKDVAMRFANHAAPPFRGARRKADVPDVFVYHYVGMQDKSSIDAKLDLYCQRDGHRLKVTDTWTEWQWGDRTQWTHAGGSAESFSGQHPPIIADVIWNLVPRSGGKLMPLPAVPWEKKVKIGVVTDGAALQVSGVREALEQVVRHFDVKLFAPSSLQIAGVTSENFDVRALQECGVSVCASSVVMRDQCKMNVRLAIDKSGVRGYDAVVGRDDPSALVWEIAHRVVSRKGGIPTGRRVRRAGDKAFGVGSLKRKIVPGKPLVVVPGTRGKALVAQVGGKKSTKLPVVITNSTKDTWAPGTHVIQATWLDGSKANPIRDAPRVSMAMPYGVDSGEVLSVDMPVPMPPMTGMLYLSIDVIEAGRRRLGVGPIVQVRTVL